ncbi:hypothetical protein K1719_044437 [Acacia pycnantha]|nr:hypothetical protein K1719_044437 [Acacia pycnantha]
MDFYSSSAQTSINYDAERGLWHLSCVNLVELCALGFGSNNMLCVERSACVFESSFSNLLCFLRVPVKSAASWD